MSWKEDARFVGAFMRGGDWEIGLRIARSVEIAGHGGDRRSGSSSELNLKVSSKEFASAAGISDNTVRKYLAAWEWAAEEGLVDHSVDLAAADEYDFDGAGLGHAEWKQFYETACMNPPPWNPQGKPLDGHYGGGRQEAAASAVSTPAPTPSREQIQEAIKADPSVRIAAREAIEEVDRDRRNNPVVDPFAPASNTMDDFTKLVLSLQSAKRNLQSALTFTLDIHGFRQQDRREAITEKVQELRNVLDAIEEAAAGRSMDEELQRLLEEGAH